MLKPYVFFSYYLGRGRISDFLKYVCSLLRRYEIIIKKANPETSLPVLQGEWRGWGEKETCVLDPGKVIENANSVPADENFEGQVLVIGLLEKQQSRNKNRSLTKNIPFQLRSFKVLLPIFIFSLFQQSSMLLLIHCLESTGD